MPPGPGINESSIVYCMAPCFWAKKINGTRHKPWSPHSCLPCNYAAWIHFQSWTLERFHTLRLSSVASWRSFPPELLRAYSLILPKRLTVASLMPRWLGTVPFRVRFQRLVIEVVRPSPQVSLNIVRRTNSPRCAGRRRRHLRIQVSNHDYWWWWW